MQRNEDIKQRLQGYPSYISKEQLCKICHISKRTALRLLEDGSIPCKSNGKQTRKYQIALADVEAFLLKRQARIKPNPREARNVYRPMSAEMKSLLPHVVTDWLEPYPDVLSVDEVVQITGYGSSSVVKWCKKEDLQHYCIGRKFFVPKTWLQEFMLSERFWGIHVKSHIHRQSLVSLERAARSLRSSKTQKRERMETMITQDQLRLDLMSDPSSYDLIVCDPALWNDLAQAGIFADLESFPQLRDAWHLWIDMSSLCRYEGRLMGVPLWLNCDLLWVNDSLTGLLESVQWPEPDWTWDDFLQLARQCCQDLNDDGRPDLYIAYQRMFDTPYAHGLQAFSLPVHQAAILYQNGQVEDMQCTEILNMLSVWKTCYDEHLLYPADGYYEEPHMNMVVFAWNMPAEWCEYAETVDIRLTMPGLSETLRCNPADSVLLSISAYSAQMELAVDFAEFYMRFGADEHHYLKEHTYALTEILPYTKTWKIPSEFHDKHYVAALQNACRDTWELSLYNDMELHLARYLRGEISAEECARLWQEKLRMTQME